MNRDEIKGDAKVAKGKIKEAAAHVADDPALHDEGVSDEAAGRAQASYGRAKRKIGEAVEHVGKQIKK
jgi:uncharacterized protein YjbJ (UPF0337 family)